MAPGPLSLGLEQSWVPLCLLVLQQVLAVALSQSAPLTPWGHDAAKQVALLTLAMSI